MTTLSRPGTGDFAPHYALYVAAVPEGDLLTILEGQLEDAAALSALPGDHRYAPGKWSVKEVLGHIVDAERIFAYRLLRIARNDATPLPGFDENLYVPESGAGARTVADLLEEFALVRRSTLALLRSLPAEALGRSGPVNGRPITASALAYVVAGHAAHHFQVLRERYAS
ncbi:MAG TPA: DinB family protein [Holophaga sp.]|nr:DinB family protein [Holophaga sp.]